MAGFKRKGSLTVEAVFVVPICLLVCFVLLQTLFYLHHVSWYTAAAWECVLTQLQESAEEEGESAEQRWQRLKGEQVLPVGEIQTAAKNTGQTTAMEIRGKMQNLFSLGAMEFSVKAKRSAVQPASLLRKLQKLTKAGGKTK